MTVHREGMLDNTGTLPWYVYFSGAMIFTVLAGWLWVEASPIAWLCGLSAPVGYFFAWRAWRLNTRK